MRGFTKFLHMIRRDCFLVMNFHDPCTAPRAANSSASRAITFSLSVHADAIRHASRNTRLTIVKFTYWQWRAISIPHTMIYSTLHKTNIQRGDQIKFWWSKDKSLNKKQLEKWLQKATFHLCSVRFKIEDFVIEFLIAKIIKCQKDRQIKATIMLNNLWMNIFLCC